MIADAAGTLLVGFKKDTVAYAGWKAKDYTLVLDAGQGSLPAGSEQMALFYGSDLLSLPVPTREGYVFVGWKNANGNACTNGGMTLSTARSFTKDAYAIGESGEVTLTAAWEEAVCKVVFDYNDGSYQSESITVRYGTPFSQLTLPEKDTGAAMILGWSQSATGDIAPADIVKSDITIYAVWGKYKIFTFYTVGTEKLEVRVFQNRAFELPAPQRAGFLLEGWYTNAACSGNPISGVTYGSGVTVYYPKWVEATYTLTFAADGIAPIVYRMGESMTLPTVSVPGYNFLGWCAKEDLSDQPRTALAATDWGDATLYPKLQPKTYTINLNPNGGTMVGEASVVITYGEAFSATLPRRTGYTFIGWYTGKGDDSVRLTDQFGSSINFFTQDGVTELFAHWTPTIYSVLFETNGGSSVANVAAPYHSTVILPEPPSKQGFLFNGWYNEDFSVEYGESFKVTGNTVIYAMWIESRAITSAEDLKAIAKDPTANYHLVCDVNLNGETWACISEFRGILTGMGYKIYNFMLSASNTSERFGFFGTNYGKIKGVIFDSVTYSYYRDGSGYGGIICGVNYGTIRDCTTQNGKINYQGNGHNTDANTMCIGNITGCNSTGGLISGCTAAISVEGTTSTYSYSNWYYYQMRGSIGGIAGEVYSTGVIENCTALLNVTAKASSVHANKGQWYPRAHHTLWVGGIVGRCFAGTVVEGCYYEGTAGVYDNGLFQNVEYELQNGVESSVGGIAGLIEGARISECIATGSVRSIGMRDNDERKSLVSYVGGLVGKVSTNATMENCIANVNVSTNGYYHDRGGIAGYVGGIVRNCYATGAVTSGSGTNGGLAGYVSSSGTLNGVFTFGTKSLAGSNAGIVNNCFYASDSAGGSAMLAEDMKSADFLRDQLYWSEEIWVLAEGEFPMLVRFADYGKDAE